MRRAIIAITGTIAGLVALLTFKSHVPSVSAADTTPNSGGGSTSSPAASQSGSPDSASSAPAATSSKAAAPGPGETTVDGAVASTIYGPVQIELTLKNSKIVKVTVLKQPDNTTRDIQIGEFAFPKLISETLAAQDAKIDAVSGASYTSAGYIQSLQSAVDRKG